jgi:hypothetical protein
MKLPSPAGGLPAGDGRFSGILDRGSRFMDSRKVRAAVVLSLVLAPCACAKKAGEREAGPVLATVNGAPITADDLSVKLGGHDLPDPGIKEGALDALIAEELMFQKAVQLGFDKDAKFQERVRAMEAKVAAYKRAEMGRRVRDTQIASRLTVTDQDVRDAYARRAEDVRTDLHLGVLQFADAAKAGEALARIRSGTPFEAIAAEQLSDAPPGLAGSWDQGFQHWDQIPEALEGAYRVKKGEVAVLGGGSARAYLVKVIDARENPAAGLESMKAAIERRLWAAKAREAYEQYVARLKQDAAITRAAAR